MTRDLLAALLFLALGTGPMLTDPLAGAAICSNDGRRTPAPDRPDHQRPDHPAIACAHAMVERQGRRGPTR